MLKVKKQLKEKMERRSLTVRSAFTILIVIAAGRVAVGQELFGSGMLATETMSRTRFGGANFQLGDVMYVSVVHPKNVGEIYVSSHMEYLTGDQWRPVPTRKDRLGQDYTSPHYTGLRDYVKLNGVPVETERKVCFFMPYEAASLESGKEYRRRYVIRLWDRNNDEVHAVHLQEDSVDVKKVNGKTIISVVVRAKACAAKPLTSQEPIPETRRSTGIVRFFNARSGKWICPNVE